MLFVSLPSPGIDGAGRSRRPRRVGPRVVVVSHPSRTGDTEEAKEADDAEEAAVVSPTVLDLLSDAALLNGINVVTSVLR